MDLEVKKEVVEDHLNTASHHENSTEPTRAEEDATLAQLSMSSSTKLKRKPKPRKIFTADEPIKSTKKKDKIILKIKKTQSDPTVKQAVAESGGKCKSYKKNKDPVDGPNPHAEVKSAAMIRAEEVQSNLEPAYPSFAKSMVRSHVASCFWMGIPGQFCKSHLPSKDANVLLEDEYGKLYEAKYFADKTGLSAGWRQFSTGHNLVEGDVLVFQLVEPLKFKVYIIRANDFSEVEGALGLLNLDAHSKQNDLILDAHTKQNDADLNFNGSNSEINAMPSQNTRRKRQKSLPLAVVQKKKKKSGQSKSASNIGQPAEQSENDSEEVGSEVLEGFKLSIPAVPFKEITSFDNFNIFVDGLVIDSELPEDIRHKYYDLCCTRNSLLHDSLIQGINIKLISGIISETVNIADAVRNCNLSTSRDEFAIWDRTLKSFELLGMNVAFLRARICRLLNLAFESEGASDARRYVDAKAQQATARDEIRNIEARLEELKEACENFRAEIESLKWKAETYERKFQEEVNAPW